MHIETKKNLAVAAQLVSAGKINSMPEGVEALRGINIRSVFAAVDGYAVIIGDIANENFFVTSPPSLAEEALSERRQWPVVGEFCPQCKKEQVLLSSYKHYGENITNGRCLACEHEWEEER